MAGEKDSITQEPLILYFSDIRRENVDKVGGKGAQLGEMLAAGFSVPSGFCITTRAYRDFMNDSGLLAKIKEAFENNGLINIAGQAQDGVNTTKIRQVSEKILEMILQVDLPNLIREEIIAAYRQLTDGNKPNLSVAVRSSATMEDLPDLSFAGQHDTYLNVSGTDDVCLHVKKCWASLWTDRAIVYRQNNNVDSFAIDFSVVVQELIPSDVSGVMFTANPVTGTDEIVINANWGLGESVVSGKVSPDQYVVNKTSLCIEKTQISEKMIMIEQAAKGTVQTEVASARQQQRCLSQDQILRLVAIGQKIENHYRCPQDIEWGLAGNEFFIFQARPITNLEKLRNIPVMWGNPGAKELLQNAVVFWSNWNVGETLPYPLTPLSWSNFNDIVFPEVFDAFFGISTQSSMAVYNNIVDLVYGRVYWNMNLLLGHPILGFITRKTLPEIDKRASKIFGLLYQTKELKPPKSRIGLYMIWFVLVNMMRVIVAYWFCLFFYTKTRLKQKCEEYWQKACAYCNVDMVGKSNEELLDVLKNFTSYTCHYWASSFLMLAHGEEAFKIISSLVKKWPDIPPSKLVAGVPGNKTTEGALALYRLSEMPQSLKKVFVENDIANILPLLEKNEEGRAFLQKLDEFMYLYGHRSAKEFDIGHPRWQEEPSFVLQMIRNYLQLRPEDTTPIQHFQAMDENREVLRQLARKRMSQSWLARLLPIRRWIFDKAMHVACKCIPFREAPKYYVLKCFYGSRRIFSEIGSRLCKQSYCDKAQDIYFLTVAEIEEIMHDPSKATKFRQLVHARRRDWDSNLKLDPPFVVRSDGKRVQYETYPEHTEATLHGTAVSSGRAQGIARIIMDPKEDSQFNKGEILVAPFTDPGWTPLFLTAKAFVMEVGGLMSHGSIVAREYGIPAVVGVKNATRIIKTGDVIIVDGDEGKVIRVQ